mgnify:CR=1 FL=1
MSFALLISPWSGIATAYTDEVEFEHAVVRRLHPFRPACFLCH